MTQNPSNPVISRIFIRDLPGRGSGNDQKGSFLDILAIFRNRASVSERFGQNDRFFGISGIPLKSWVLGAWIQDWAVFGPYFDPFFDPFLWYFMVWTEYYYIGT